MIISFSGLDSSGKGTQIECLSSYFASLPVPYKVLWARPGYTPVFVFFKNLFIKTQNTNIDLLNKRKKRALSNKFIANIWIYVSLIDLLLYWGVYIRLLNKKYIIIADRYVIDAYVDLNFQFSNVNISKLLTYKAIKLLVPFPNLSIFLDLDPSISIERQLNKQDKFPVDLLSLKDKADLYYSELGNYKYDFLIINANQSVVDIATIIQNKIGLNV